MISSLWLLADVTIGFLQTLYSVQQGAGVAVVQVGVISGSIADNLIVNVHLFTMNNTARGYRMLYGTEIYTHNTIVSLTPSSWQLSIP